MDVFAVTGTPKVEEIEKDCILRYTMACSKFMEDKYRNHFRFLDVDKDGFVTANDMYEIGQNILWSCEAGDKDRIRFKELVDKWWLKFQPMAIDGKVTQDAYVASSKLVYENDLPKVTQDILKTQKVLFDIMDRNKDNVISLKEFRIFYSIFNVTDREIAQNVFKQIDIDGDGYLTREEWAVARVNYFTCDDPRVGYAFMMNFLK